MEFFNTIKPALESLMAVVLTTVFSYVGLEIKRLYQRYADSQEKKDVVRSTVTYVEQIGKDMNGPDKLSMALTTASGLLKSRGIDTEPQELRTLVEAAVNGLKKGLA